MTPDAPSKFEPLSWLLLFSTRTRMPWLDRLVFGRFKHVTAMGWVEAAGSWVIYDVQLCRTRITVMPEEEGTAWVGRCIAADPDAVVLRVPVHERGPRWFRFGSWCVPAVKHLIGLGSGALRPSRLFRDCLAAGAEIIHGTVEPSAVSAEPTGTRRASCG